MRTRTQRLNWRTPRNKSLGQGMAEYIIIVALVAVAGIATWQLVGSSIGQSADPARVIKGTRMAGRYGGVRVTVRNLKVVRADAENNVVLVEGAIPGPNGGFVVVRHSARNRK